MRAYNGFGLIVFVACVTIVGIFGCGSQSAGPGPDPATAANPAPPSATPESAGPTLPAPPPSGVGTAEAKGTAAATPSAESTNPAGRPGVLKALGRSLYKAATSPTPNPQPPAGEVPRFSPPGQGSN